jgi:hypothetical protein
MGKYAPISINSVSRSSTRESSRSSGSGLNAELRPFAVSLASPNLKDHTHPSRPLRIPSRSSDPPQYPIYPVPHLHYASQPRASPSALAHALAPLLPATTSSLVPLVGLVPMPRKLPGCTQTCHCSADSLSLVSGKCDRNRQSGSNHQV